MADLPRGTVTFLFTDIEGSTQLWERDRAAMRTAVERHLALMRGAITGHRGVLYKIVGDGTQAAFPTALDGLLAALDAQRALVAESWPDPPGLLRVRMALHAGEAEPNDDDYLAAPLNRLMRLLETAHPEQILLSHTMASLVSEVLPQGVTLKALGEFRLRDILQPEEIFQLCHPGLWADFPPLNTPGRLPHNLPIHPTPFLGREREVQEVVTLLLRPDVRLVTLTGTGGVGKTRLGLRVAAEALESFPDGAFLVDLARLTDPDLVLSATATALGLREQPGHTLAESLASYLRERRILLLLDNFEHVLPAAMLVADLLGSAPDLKVLATSRARLDLQAEYEFRVETLPVPDPGTLPPLEVLAQYDAVQLFISRSQALRPGFELSTQNAAAIGEIVRRLEGLPLAIELAAARLKLLTPQALLGRLDRRLSTLTGGARDLPARQRTLRETISWSHDLLAPDEQVLFRRLSVYVGGWTLEGTEAVASIEGDTNAIGAVETLAGLFDQSLVDMRTGSDRAEPRYFMLETIREFAGERLQSSGDFAATERALQSYLVSLVERAEQGLQGLEQSHWLDRLEAEHDNLRAALGRALQQEDGELALRLTVRLWRFWLMRGYPGEGRTWLERASASGSTAPADLRAKALQGLGHLAFDLGNYVEARKQFEVSLALCREVNDRRGIAESLSGLGVVALNRQEYAEAQLLNEEALAIRRELGDKYGIAWSLYYLGIIARERGDYAPAGDLLRESLAMWQEQGNASRIGLTLVALGMVSRFQSDPKGARPLIEEGLTVLERIGYRFGAAIALMQLGHVSRLEGNDQEAIQHYASSLSRATDLGANEMTVENIEFMACVASALAQPIRAGRLFGAAAALRSVFDLPPPMDSEAVALEEHMANAKRAAMDNWASAWSAGQAMTLEQAIAEARELLLSEPNPAASTPVSGKG